MYAHVKDGYEIIGSWHKKMLQLGVALELIGSAEKRLATFNSVLAGDPSGIAELRAIETYLENCSTEELAALDLSVVRELTFLVAAERLGREVRINQVCAVNALTPVNYMVFPVLSKIFDRPEKTIWGWPAAGEVEAAFCRIHAAAQS